MFAALSDVLSFFNNIAAFEGRFELFFSLSLALRASGKKLTPLPPFSFPPPPRQFCKNGKNKREKNENIARRPKEERVGRALRFINYLSSAPHRYLLVFLPLAGV